MKKVIAFLCLLWSVSVFSQHRMYIGGEAGLSHGGESDMSFVRVAPFVGYELNDKWDIGLYVAYLSSYQEKKSDKFSLYFALAPFARYYFKEKGVFQPFIESSVGYSFSDQKINSEKKESKEGFEIGLKPGFCVKLHEKIRLSAKFAFIGYRKDYLTYENGYIGHFNLNNLDLGLIIDF